MVHCDLALLKQDVELRGYCLSGVQHITKFEVVVTVNLPHVGTYLKRLVMLLDKGSSKALE